MKNRNSPIATTTIISILLVLCTFALYFQVVHHDFTNHDDDIYITENHRVNTGLSFEGFKWAFTANLSNHWHPVTWLSHMLDCQLFGLSPGCHHLSSLFLHSVNTLLLFLVLKWMTGAPMASAFVAALFAWHPLHVESVAWVSDRKDLLSALFWLLTMWAYLYYVKRPGFRRYLLIIFAFILGLMSKPMIMTLPLILLLLDYWPLDRFQWGQARPSMILGGQRSSALNLILEKVPLIGLAGISGMLTFLIMKGDRTATLVKMLPREATTANTLVSYAVYIGKMLWPADLAIPYLHPGRLPLWQAGGAALILLCITLLAFRWMKIRPYLFVGWLWYLVTLVPVVGLVKMGPDTMADRYTYVPLMGLFIIMAWGVPSLVSGWRYPRVILALAAGISLSASLALSWFQIPHWRNSMTLFEHTLRVIPDNFQAHNNMGLALLEQGKVNESIYRFNEVLRIRSSFPDAHNNLGNALLRQGKEDEAITHYQAALRISPNNPKYRRNLGLAYMAKGELESAMGEFEISISINPDFPEVVNDMGLCYVKKGMIDRAIALFQRAVDLRPDYAYAINNLGQCYHIQGRFDLALAQFKKALAITPDSAEVYCNLGTTLASKGLFTEAEVAVMRAIDLNPQNPISFNSLANLYAQQGMIDRAVETRKKALAINPNNSGKKTIANQRNGSTR